MKETFRRRYSNRRVHDFCKSLDRCCTPVYRSEYSSEFDCVFMVKFENENFLRKTHGTNGHRLNGHSVEARRYRSNTYKDPMISLFFFFYQFHEGHP